jgi:hypothetical protein
MTTKTLARRPLSQDEHTALLWAALVISGDYPEAMIKRAIRTLEVAAETFLSHRTKRTIVALDGLGTYRTDDPQHERVVRAEIDLQAVVTVGNRITLIESESWAAPVRVLRLANLENVPLAIAGKVRNESVRAHLRKVTDTSPRGYHWEPKLETEPLNDESLRTGLRKVNGRWEATNMSDEGAPALTDWFDEHERRLQHAEHPTLRAVHKALTSGNPPQGWAQLASRVGHTEQWIRKLIKREFGARVDA